MRRINKNGDGANTNKNGLWFEQTTSLNHTLLQNGFAVVGSEVYFDNCFVGWSVPQNQIYSQFLRPQGIHYQNYNSKAWRPDECFINKQLQTVYIIEKKFQNSSGSVDEKLVNFWNTKNCLNHLVTKLNLFTFLMIGSNKVNIKMF